MGTLNSLIEPIYLKEIIRQAFYYYAYIGSTMMGVKVSNDFTYHAYMPNHRSYE